MSESKLIVLRGLPASGKTTCARELLTKRRAVRVNRDLLREMLHFDRYSSKTEWRVIEIEEMIAGYFLRQGFDVVVDDTNLKKRDVKRWRKVATEASADFDVRPMETSVEECIRRDAERAERTVGTERIREMAKQSELYDNE